MNLNFRPTSYQTIDDSRLLACWLGDPSIRHLSQPQLDGHSLANPETAEQIRARNQYPTPFRPVDVIIEFGGGPACAHRYASGGLWIVN